MQQRALAEKSTVLDFRRRARTHNDLVSLAAPVLDVVLQLRAELVKPSDDLRRTIDGLLGEMESRGATLRYSTEQIQASKFALAAFVDETALANDFPLRDEWEKYPLQLEYFGEHLAGVKFFDRLDQLLQNPEANAEAIEVYYLCMLLGFKGKYRIYLEDQLKGVIANTAEHLRRVGRLQTGGLSPHWEANDQPTPAAAPELPLWVKIGGAATLGSIVLLFIALKFITESSIGEAINQLLR